MIDLSVLLLALLSSAIFMLTGIHRVFNFYLGVILLFFVFLVLNFKIKLLELSTVETLDFWEKQFLENKEFYLSLVVFLIPVVGVIFLFLSCKSKKNIIVGALYGFFLPFFLVGVFAYIWKNIAVNIAFLDNISDLFVDSKIFDFFYDAESLFFFLIIFFMFSKFIYYLGKILLHFIAWYTKSFSAWLFNRREEKRLEREKQNKRTIF